jgi:energy-coupling factor transporter ATP-binding protein EcfA2
MSLPSIANISIENLRGSVAPFSLVFEKGKKLTIIYGENGTGKSTISDAFDLLGNGKVGSLETRGLGSTRKYWHTVGKTASDVKVVLATSSGECSISLGKNDVVVTNTQLRPQVAVLRRSQILELIEAKPADRYKAISRFVDVSGVETSEDALRRLIRDKSGEQNTAATRIAENRLSIENFWNQAGKPAPDALNWAEQEVKRNQNQLDQRKEAIERLILMFDNLAVHPQRIDGLVNQLNETEVQLKDAQQALGALQNSVASDYLEILDILKAAQAHFHKHPNPTMCPLCESSEKAKGLDEEVNRRIHSQGLLNKLEAAKGLAAAKDAVFRQAHQRLEDAKVSAATDARAIEAYCGSGEIPADVKLPALPVPDDVAQWGSWFVANRDLRTKWKADADACVDDKKFINALRTSLDTLRSNEASAMALDALLPRLKQTLELIESERKKFTDGILGAISIRVGQLYDAIHPGEGLNKISLELDAAKRASLEIATEFGGQPDAPPQAYFSDSHLDTLGLCVFLALAERDSPDSKILVLDDVLGSVDEPHVERIIGMIYDVSQKFRHSIVTTHYRPWREKFRWGVLKPDQVCHFVELNQWAFNKGITLSGAIIPEISRLKTLLADPNPDVQAICGKAGVILEALLDFITLQYGCAVPRRHGNAYVLSDLLGAVNGKLLAALKAEMLDQNTGGKIVGSTDLKPILDDIAAIAQARNVLGAHFNAMAFDLYPADGIRFAKLVEQLSNALVCPDHGRPMKDTGSYWRNGGDTRRLHPLKKPS